MYVKPYILVTTYTQIRQVHKSQVSKVKHNNSNFVIFLIKHCKCKFHRENQILVWSCCEYDDNDTDVSMT